MRNQEYYCALDSEEPTVPFDTSVAGYERQFTSLFPLLSSAFPTRGTAHGGDSKGRAFDNSELELSMKSDTASDSAPADWRLFVDKPRCVRARLSFVCVTSSLDTLVNRTCVAGFIWHLVAKSVIEFSP